MATAWRVYDAGKIAIGEDSNLSTGSYKMALMAGTYSPDLAGQATFTAIVGDEAPSTDNGYTAGGNALADIDWQVSAGTAKWDATDASWTQAGAQDLVSTYAVIYDTASDALICYTDFGSEQTVVGGTGAMFFVQFAANGIIAMSGGTA